MPRSFLIKKSDYTSQDNIIEDIDYKSENKESDSDISKQDRYRGPLSPNSDMAFIRQAAFENNNFLPFLAHAATAMFTMPHSWKVKKELYNEFFVLDDPQIWQVYAERQQSMYFHAKIQQQQQHEKQQQQHDSIKQEIVVDTESSSEKVPSSKPGELSPKSNDENEKVYQCQYCNKSFTRSWNFQRHVLIHTGRKPHKCDKCPKAFVLAAHLKIHNRIHTGEKPYKCNICGRGFAQLTNLQRHVLTHTGEKPHKCTYCAKGFVSSSDLRRHVRIHTGEKPYKCKVCSKAFTTSGNLQSHILTHTGEKPYQCDVCNWKFISSSNLRTHIRTHHFQNGEDIKKDSDEGES